VYVDNENIYFIDNTENNNIFKMNTDGSNLRKIIQRGANNFIVDKDKIFYSCYNYINGTQNIIIAEDLKRRMVNDLDIIQKDVAEKSVDGGFYSSDLEGKNEVKLLPDVYTNFYIKDDYVYYTNGSALYKMKKDSNSKIKLITDGSFYDYGITQSSVYHVNSQPNIRLNIYGDYIYYLNNYDKNRLYRIRTDKSGKERVTDERGMGLYLLSEGYIYYYPSSDNGHIYRINVDGTNKIRID
jgi:hypothetical protein